jgi:hypothetical protein
MCVERDCLPVLGESEKGTSFSALTFPHKSHLKAVILVIPQPSYSTPQQQSATQGLKSNQT